MTKVKVTCTYGVGCRSCCVFFKVEYKECISVYVGNTSKKNRMEQHFQYLAQNVQYYKN